MGPKARIKANSATHRMNGFSGTSKMLLFSVAVLYHLKLNFIINLYRFLTFLQTRFLEVCGHRQLHILHTQKCKYVNTINHILCDKIILIHCCMSYCCALHTLWLLINIVHFIFNLMSGEAMRIIMFYFQNKDSITNTMIQFTCIKMCLTVKKNS